MEGGRKSFQKEKHNVNQMTKFNNNSRYVLPDEIHSVYVIFPDEIKEKIFKSPGAK